MSALFKKSNFKTRRERLKLFVVVTLQIFDALIFICSFTLITSYLHARVLFSSWLED